MLFENGGPVYSDISSGAEYRITVTSIEEERTGSTYIHLHECGFFSVGGLARVYLKRPGENFEEVFYYWDHGATLGNLTDLPAGEYVIRVIAVASVARLEDGVLLNYTDSLPAYFYLEVDSEGNFIAWDTL